MLWIPGHVHYKPHDTANDLAVTATHAEQITDIKPETSEINGSIDDFIVNKWKAQWASECKGMEYKNTFPLVTNGTNMLLKPR